MKRITLIFIEIIISVSFVSAQVAISTNASSPDNSAMLDVKSNSKGILVPRMTSTERDAISNPATGLLIFCTTDSGFYYNRGTPSSKNWVMIQNGLTNTQINNWDNSLIPLFSTTDTGYGLVIGSNNVDATHYLNAYGAWTVPPIPSAMGTVTHIHQGNGMSFDIDPITVSGTISLGIPSTLTGITTNDVTTTSHSHQVATLVPTLGSDYLSTSGQIFSFVNNYSISLWGDVTGGGPIETPIITSIGNNKIKGQMIDLTGNVQGNIMYYNGTDWVVLTNGTTGQVLKTQGTNQNPIWSADNNSGGTVTSVGLSLPLTEFSISGSPVINSGTLTATWINQSANKVFASPNGTSGSPTFRTLVDNDIPDNITASNYVPTTRTISTTAPLAGGGPLSSNLTLSIPGSSGSQNGYMSSGDYTMLHSTQAGGVVFYAASSGGITSDNSNFVWDNTNKKLTVKSTTSTGTGIIGIGNNISTGYTATEGSGGAFTGSKWGLYGRATNTSGERAGGYFFTDASAYARVGGYTSGGVATLIWGVGAVMTQSLSFDGKAADLYCPISPEMIITDYGTGKLSGGKCHIDIDPTISKRIFVSEDFPLKVFVQLEGDCSGVYVTNKSANGFDVVELMSGKSNTAFSWMFTAYRNDLRPSKNKTASKFQNERLKEYNIH